MRGTPFAKRYPGSQRAIWDRFDRLPQKFRKMVADDPDGHLLTTLEAAEQLAREAGLLPQLEEKQKELSKKELRQQKDKDRTKAAKARSRIVYYIAAGSGAAMPSMRKPSPSAASVKEEEGEPAPQPKCLHNS